MFNGCETECSDDNSKSKTVAKKRENSYHLGDTVRQLGKGVVLIGLGVCTYLGLSGFLFSRKSNEKRGWNNEDYYPDDANLVLYKGKVPNVPTEFGSLEKFSSLGAENLLEHFEIDGGKFNPISIAPTTRKLLSIEDVEDTEEAEKVKEAEKIHNFGLSISHENKVQNPPHLSPHRMSRRKIEESTQCEEFRVNTFTTGEQSYSSVASLGDNGFVVVWSNEAEFVIHGQRFNLAGEKLGSEFQVNIPPRIIAPDQSPSVASFGNNSFVIVWGGSGEVGGVSTYGQRYSSNGVKVGNLFVATDDPVVQHSPSVASLEGNGFVVTWMDQGDGPYQEDGIYGQRYNLEGEKLESNFHINTYTINEQGYPSVAGLGDNGFVVTWASAGQDGNGFGVYGQCYNKTGGEIGSEFRVNTFTTGNQAYPSVTSLSDGGFVVTWQSYSQDGDNYGIYGQRYNATGGKIGGEFQINTNITGAQAYPSVASLGDNGFVVTWQSYGQDGDNYGIYGQRYNATGGKIGSEFRINTYTTGDQSYPSAASLGDNSFVVVWMSADQDGSGYGIYGRLFASLNHITTNNLTINEGETVTLNSAILNTDIPCTLGSALNYTVSDIQHGYFDAISDPGIPITSFTQQNITDGEIRFHHDDSKSPPSYRVKVSDGKAETNLQLVAVDFNQRPEFSKNRLRVYNNLTVILTSDMLFAIDDKSGNDTLTFIVNNVTHGHFARIASPEMAITTFSQLEILDLDIQFVHDGSGYAPEYNLIANDGVWNSTINPARIAFNGMNESPTISTNHLSICQGQTIILTSDTLAATDNYNTANELIFSVNNIAHGRFEQKANPGVAITHFSQQEIIAGDIQFVHDDSEFAPAYEVKVSDGDHTTDFVAAFVTFNPTPKLVNNSLAINENQTIVLTGDNLWATDVDTENSAIIFTVDNVLGGRFAEVTNPGVAIFQFTQQQIADGAIQFVDDGDEIAPSYQVKVTDGYTTTDLASALINFTKVSDLPQLINKRLTIGEGQTIILTSNNFNATDVDNNDMDLVFIVENIQHGQFEHTDDPGIAITSFTQQEIANGAIQFVHDGTKNAPVFAIKVSDGVATTALVSAIIEFDQTPILINNQIVINEGETKVVTKTMLNATDVDGDDLALTFAVSNVQNGQFEQVSNPGIAIFQFTQQQVINGEIQFVTDGGEIAPSYYVTVGDGRTWTAPEFASVTFVNNVNDAPELVNNRLSINKGETVNITTAMLKGIDPDNIDSELYFIVDNIAHGRFEKSTNPGVAITQFTQQDVVDGIIRFVHDGSDNPPSYEVQLYDGNSYSTSTVVTVYFNLPVIKVCKLTIKEDRAVILTSDMLSATDIDSDYALLEFMVRNVQYGRFERVNNSGVAIANFTQQEVNDGEIKFVHSGGKMAPSFEVQVSDGVLQSLFIAAQVNFNAMPTLEINRLTIEEGQEVVLTSNMLNAMDIDSNDLLLEFIVRNVQHGRFEKIDNPGMAIANFTQQEVNDGAIKFVHTGGKIAPSYEVQVNDGDHQSSFAAAQIKFNSAPILDIKPLTLKEGEAKILNVSEINAIDLEGEDATIVFTVQDTKHIRFENISDPGMPITQFTLQAIKAGKIKVMHDNSEIAPSFNIKVSDGSFETPFKPAIINYTAVNDHAPVIERLGFAVKKGGAVILDATKIYGTDADLDTSVLTYTPKNVQNGYFARVMQPNVVITNFTQQEISNRQIQFVHKGEKGPTCFDLEISDGMWKTTKSVNITVTSDSVLFPPITIIIGSGSAAMVLCAVGFGVLGCTVVGIRFFTAKQKEHNCLADADWLYKETIKKYEEAIINNPNNPAIYYDKGRIELAEGHTSLALISFGRGKSYDTSIDMTTKVKEIIIELMESKYDEIKIRDASTAILKLFLQQNSNASNYLVDIITCELRKFLNKNEKQKPQKTEVEKFAQDIINRYLQNIAYRSKMAEGIIENIINKLDKVKGISKSMIQIVRNAFLRLFLEHKIDCYNNVILEAGEINFLENILPNELQKVLLNNSKKQKNQLKESELEKFARQTISRCLEEIIIDTRLKITAIAATELPEYKMDNKIGEGKFGLVYRGKWNKIDVAIKLVFPPNPGDNDDWPNALKEAKVTANLAHKNIIKVYGFCSGKRAIVMKHMESSLRNFIYPEAGRTNEYAKNFPWLKILDIALGIAEGIRYLHSHKVFHCDLKPENILLDKKFTPKLADFGLSRVKKFRQNQRSLKGDAGTPEYRAPELDPGYEYNSSCDIFSFSVILWEMAARISPYIHISFRQHVPTSLAARAIEFEKYPKHFPLAYKKLIQRCWSLNPKKRPTIDEIIKELENLQRTYVSPQEFLQISKSKDHKKIEAYTQVGDDIRWTDFINYDITSDDKEQLLAMYKEYPVTTEVVGLEDGCVLELMPKESLKKENLKENTIYAFQEVPLAKSTYRYVLIDKKGRSFEGKVSALPCKDKYITDKLPIGIAIERTKLPNQELEKQLIEAIISQHKHEAELGDDKNISTEILKRREENLKLRLQSTKEEKIVEVTIVIDKANDDTQPSSNDRSISSQTASMLN